MMSSFSESTKQLEEENKPLNLGQWLPPHVLTGNVTDSHGDSFLSCF